MNKFSLIDMCCFVYDHPKYKPADGKSYCNIAVNAIACVYGFVGFRGMTANQMVAVMDQDGFNFDWPNGLEAQLLANRGHLVIAGQKAEPHGHVCVIRPAEPTFSGKWNEIVPMAMNIGSTNSISKGVNYIFKDRPKYYHFKRGFIEGENT